MSRLCSILLVSLAAVLLLIHAGGCSTARLRNPYATEYDPNYGMNKDQILTSFNLHRGRWWNYYERGLWLLAAHHYAAARDDFGRAVDLRSNDKWDARKYGMRFTDYFPHREWGIALYLEGERASDAADKERAFAKAMEQLKTSIAQEPSSKAWFYLRRATAGYWKTTQADTTPPGIAITNSGIDRWADVPTFYINQYVATLEIEASDSQSGVAAVWVDGRRLFIESVRSDFRGSAVVTVEAKDQTKMVVVKAVDLAGNEARPTLVRLVVDTHPPTAAISVHPDSRSLFGGRIPVEITAVDDQGLRSVQTGEDPYDRRECRGQTTWDGILYAQPGTRELAIEVTDLAGNVTATSIPLEPGQVTSRGDGLRPPDRWSSLRHAGLFCSDIDGGMSPRAVPLNPWAWVWPAATHTFRTDLEPPGVLRLASYRVKPPDPTLEFREFRGRTLVRTTHDSYFLQGEITYAPGPVTITVQVDGEKLPSPQVMKRGDYLIFCGRVPLPRAGITRCVEVKAFCQDGRCIGERELHVERVANCVYEPSAVYAIMLLPLEEKLTPADPKGQHRDPNRAHDVVLNALRSCRLDHPNDPNCLRFNCTALKGWTTQKMESELGRLGIAKSSPERRFIELAGDYRKNKTGPAIELGFYGRVAEDANSLEVILEVFDVKSRQHPFAKIDIFGSKENPEDPNWHTKGLVAKLQQTIPRIAGQVTDVSQTGRIALDCGSDKGVFPRMDVCFYREEEGYSRLLCSGNIGDVRRGRSEVRVADTAKWRTVRDSPPKQIRAISK